MIMVPHDAFRRSSSGLVRELDKQLALGLKATGFGILWRLGVELGAIVGKVHRGAHPDSFHPRMMVSVFSPSFFEDFPTQFTKRGLR